MNIPEKILLLLFSAVSLYMFIEGESFSSDVAIFPQTFAGLTLLFVGLIAARPVYRGFSGESESALAGLTSYSDTESDRGQEAHAEDPVQEQGIRPDEAIETAELDNRRLAIISALTFGYILVSYAIGLLWATPLFLVGYGAVFGVSKKDLFVIIILSTAITFAFMELTNIQLMEGVLTR
jgi:hypothetical protein